MIQYLAIIPTGPTTEFILSTQQHQNQEMLKVAKREEWDLDPSFVCCAQDTAASNNHCTYRYKATRNCYLLTGAEMIAKTCNIALCI